MAHSDLPDAGRVPHFEIDRLCSVLLLDTDALLAVVQPASAAKVILVIRATASQSGALQEWRDSDDAALAYVAAGGQIVSSSGRIANTTRVTTTYTALATDEVIYCDTDGGAFTLTLPAGVEGTHYKIVNVGSSANDLTVDPNGTEQLRGGGAGVASTVADGEILDIHYNATEGWW